MVDDDADDCLLVKDALGEINFPGKTHYLENGKELLDYLKGRGQYENVPASVVPGVILLDLNMPIKDGRETLREIKADRALRKIPIVVFTTSQNQQDIQLAYDLGANTFMIKPSGFDELVAKLRAFMHYWVDCSELPKALN